MKDQQNFQICFPSACPCKFQQTEKISGNSAISIEKTLLDHDSLLDLRVKRVLFPNQMLHVSRILNDMQVFYLHAISYNTIINFKELIL